MRFSEWQLVRLRNALGAYHDYERDSDGNRYNWKDLTEGIDDAVELDFLKNVRDPENRVRLVKQFSERLRQFVEGVRRPDGTWHYPEPQESTVDAIYKFVTDADLLSDEELREPTPGPQAALRLLEYLDQTFDTERIAPPSTLEGTYHSERFEADDFVVRDLTLHRASERGLIQLGMTEDSYDLLTGAQFARLTPKNRREARKSQIRFGGWAILTPENNLLMFLKKEHNGENCYYLTVAAENWHALQAPPRTLALLRHHYPLDTDDGEPLEPKRMPAIAEAVGNNIALFSRTK
jgi:hypothetical protein